MGFRAPLDLTEILPAYREHLGSFSGTTGINFIKPAVPETEDYQEQSLGWGRAAPALPERSVEDPLRVGNGPATCSTGQEVVLARPAFSWDVNGWYRTLGVPFPYVNATSGVLSRSYIAAEGQSSARATYYLKRLLDKAVRGLYDDMPLGEKFLDDEFVQDEMKARAQAEASRRSAEGSYTKAATVLDEWGYLLKPEDEDPLDTTSNGVQDERAPESDNFAPIEWTYSYWLWRSHREDVANLEQWQALLVSALAGRGQKVNLAVGYVGRQPHSFVVGRSDGYWVVYLNDAQAPTPEIAAKAADALLHDMNDQI